MRTIWWDPKQECVMMLDQSKLPLETRILSCKSFQELKQAIAQMRVRGAPALAAAGGFGMVLALRELEGDPDQLRSQLQLKYRELISVRPTAVNLSLGASRVVQAAISRQGKSEMMRAAISEAIQILESDIKVNRQLSQIGSQLIQDGDGVLTHCNAGALACVDIGTALGIIKFAHSRGIKFQVYITETRPWNQGSRLSAHELLRCGIRPKLIVDSAAGFLMAQGKINKLILGADRVVRDGVFNKIGTYSLAVLANHHRIPFYVAVPSSSLDLARDHSQVEIEYRSPQEITKIHGITIAPPGLEALNPVFDFTPFKLITKLITEHGIFTPEELIQRYKASSESKLNS